MFPLRNAQESATKNDALFCNTNLLIACDTNRFLAVVFTPV